MDRLDKIRRFRLLIAVLATIILLFTVGFLATMAIYLLLWMNNIDQSITLVARLRDTLFPTEN